MENGGILKHRFHISGKEIQVYPSAAPNRPLILLNTFQEEGDRVYQALRGSHVPEHTLVAVSGLEWNHDMAPWDIPPISGKDDPCTGGADGYLELLIERILPEAERLAPGEVLWRGLAGYSLAGLFALYAMYRTGAFSRFASVSGSLWFPGFWEYVLSHEMKAAPECLYFSLGDRESRTRNSFLKTVQERTEAIHAFYRQKGIDADYRLNPGNHFQDAVQRMMLGISWILSR